MPCSIEPFPVSSPTALGEETFTGIFPVQSLMPASDQSAAFAVWQSPCWPWSYQTPHKKAARKLPGTRENGTVI
jgi:hypothetical protein